MQEEQKRIDEARAIFEQEKFLKSGSIDFKANDENQADFLTKIKRQKSMLLDIERLKNSGEGESKMNTREKPKRKKNNENT